MSIEVSKLTKLYGEQKALDEVSFEIKKGEIVGFLGPNGAGKSTMMKILTGYIPQSEGQAKLCGLNVESESIAVREKVGYLPEHNPLYLEMYVKEYLNFMAGIHSVSKEQVDAMITKVGLEPEKHKKLGQLSKGYRQRVGLAAALLHEPEVLILDEPTTGLDVNQLVEIRQLIKEAGANKTVMLSTHIMQEVEYLCDRVIIINKGKIVADRPIADLKELTLGTVYQVEFDKEFSKSALRKINGIKHVEELGANKWLLEGRPDIDLRTGVFEFAVEQGAAVLEIQKRAASLEEVFKKLTN
ncbi:gliding motility-associated ABC transporter ATP-binding subunit GldA [Croceimicrobium hydrocarbonivorans]|uniref:Gliding motility-associated ABC transporter ATP-binding subunit GldA n=1 Tax=Croceimicrobium hydrocarbonivorans TaxID=2761580 RepID=A0A7H0VAZ9_9FLAO|nr:gliding motility-associated ABC transporter ATP-binding subunit GldA [Croceimicrobium hydrocarbonivorans]QNR22897.1 gliding motility-associated ABC transporter ATP-binding subunit GldA [Croceimicrobium hydrocarbonivorans]